MPVTAWKGSTFSKTCCSAPHIAVSVQWTTPSPSRKQGVGEFNISLFKRSLWDRLVRDRVGVDENLAGRQVTRESAFTEKNVLYDLATRQAKDTDIRLGKSLLRSSSSQSRALNSAKARVRTSCTSSGVPLSARFMAIRLRICPEPERASRAISASRSQRRGTQ